MVGNFRRKIPETYFGKLKEWTKPEIDAKVLEMLMGTATIVPEKVKGTSLMIIGLSGRPLVQ
jgi:hypothetical protein